MEYQKGKELTEEVKRLRHGAALPDTEKDALDIPDDTLNYINGSFNPLKALGYTVDEKTLRGKTMPRVFVLHQDEDGTMRKLTLDQANIKPGSREFWREAQRGSLLAYPSGVSKPVQIQLSVPESGRPEIGYSKPGDPAAFVSGRLKKPNFFKRMFHKLNENWFKADFDAWENQERSVAVVREGLKKETGKRDEAYCAQELEETKKAEEAHLAEQRKEELDKLVANAEARANRAKISMQYSEAIFEPEPKIFSTEETEKKYPGRTANDEIHDKLFRRKVNGKSVEGFMSAEEYANLTQIGEDKLNLNAIKLGNSGRTVTRGDFCALALFTATSSDIGMNTQKKGPAQAQSYDPSALPGLLELGYSEQEAREILNARENSIYTTDTFMHPPRSGSGKFIKDTINIARLRTAEALGAYKKGNLEPLGRLIANGINRQAGNAAQEETTYGAEFAGGCESSRKLLGLMEADPRLREAALKAGMAEENLAVVEGLDKLCQLDEKACQANLRLAKAERDGVKLSAEEKQALSQDILTAQLAFHLMITENANQKCPEIDKMVSFTGKFPDADQLNDLEYLEKNRPEGKLWGHTAFGLAEGMKTIYRKKPNSITTIQSPTGFENLRKTAAELVRQEKLTELRPGELVEKLAVDKADYGMAALGQKGLLIMKEKGMLEPEVTKIIKKELSTGAKEKLVPETQKKAPGKRLEAEKKAGAPEVTANV